MQKQTLKKIGHKLLIGRHEWCALPGLKIPLIKGKIDTGALTSAIHAFNIKPIKKNKVKYVSFDVYPLQANTDIIVHCQSRVIDERYIMSSNGHQEKRYIIQTALRLGTKKWLIEVSLSNRDPLKYRLLLGRQALRKKVLIDPDHGSYQKVIVKKSKILAYYQ